MIAINTEKPVVTVTTPAYNVERFIAATIQSVQRQTFQHYEHIIIDDGSKDQTAAVIREFAKRDPRIRFITRENRGVCATRNQMLSMARGEFVAVVDADDICAPDRLERHVRFLRDHEDYVAVGGRVMYTDADGDPLCPCNLLRRDHDEIDRAHLEGVSGAISHPSCMIRRAALDRVGGYRIDQAEDIELFLRLAEIGKLGNLPEVSVYYRQHLTSACHTQPKTYTNIPVIVNEARKRRGLPTIEVKLEPWHSPSVAEQHRKWGWWALMSQNTSTARKHAWRALRKDPISSRSWKLLLCALRGY